MKKIFISLILSFLYYFGIAQVQFDKDYFMNPGIFFLVKELQNSNYNIWYASTLIASDKFGDTLFIRRYGSSIFGIASAYVNNSNANGYLITGSPADTCNGSNTRCAIIGVIDSSYQVMWSKNYRFTDECLAYGTGIVQDINNNILLGGYTDIKGLPYHYRPFVIKTDSIGNIKWAHHFIVPKVGKCDFVHQTLDGNYLAGINLDSIGGLLMKTDTTGLALWTKHYNIPHSWLQGYLEDTDSTILIYGYTDSSGDVGYPDLALFIARLTKDGNVIWGKRYGDSTHVTGYSYTKIIKTSDGNYAVITPIYYPSGTSGQTNTLLMKVDYNGNVIWATSHGDSGHDEYPGGIIQTNDGGFILGGGSDGFFPGNPILSAAQLFKTDATGYVGCDEFNEIISVQPYFLTDSIMPDFTFFNGTLAWPANLNDSAYNAPEYYGQVTKCLFTDVQQQTLSKEQTTIYPNPSTGKFTIKTGKSTPKKTITDYITVYDSIGKIILQKPITKEEDKQVDLTKHGKGLYLIKITENNKVSEGKAVVQ